MFRNMASKCGKGYVASRFLLISIWKGIGTLHASKYHCAHRSEKDSWEATILNLVT